MRIHKGNLINMHTDKFDFQYDSEYDVLFIYNKAGRSSHGIEWGNIDVSYDNKGKLVNFSLNNASSLLTNLTGKNITKETLKQITNCKISIKEKEGILYINFKFYLKDKTMIEDTLPIKALNYCSPVSSAR